MNAEEIKLNYAPAVRAAAGLTDVGTAVDTAAHSLSTAMTALSWGRDAVGEALRARYESPRRAVESALPAVAESLRQLDATVQSGVTALVSADERNADTVQRIDVQEV